MSTKAQMIAKFQEVYTSNPDVTDWDEVEETLHTEPESILENIYATPINEVSSGTHVITTPNSNFTYDVTFSKAGRNVTVTGTFTAQETVGVETAIFTIDLSEFDCVDESYYGIATKADGTQIIVYMRNDGLFTQNTIIDGEKFRFTLTYSLLN